MVAAADPVKLRRHRRIAWYVIFAFFFAGVVLANFGSAVAASIAAACLFLLVFLSLFYVLLLGYRIGRIESEQAKLIVKEDIKLQPYWRMLAGNLLFAGTFVLSMCSTSALMGGLALLVVIGVLLPMAVSVKNRESYELWRQRWTRFLIYAIAVSLGMGFGSQASKKEQNSYDSIIAAVERYKADEKRYPDALEQLVPKYLAAVPTARIGTFIYGSSNPDDAHLSYMPEPFIHKSYNFKSKTSKTWD